MNIIIIEVSHEGKQHKDEELKSCGMQIPPAERKVSLGKA